MSDPNTDNKTESKGDDEQRENVAPSSKKRKPMDIVIQVAAALAAICAFVVGYISLTGWKSKESYGLWVSYVGIILILLVVAAYIQKQMWENAEAAKAPPPAAKGRPYLSYSLSALKKPLEAGGKPVLQIMFKNTGQTEAHATVWNNTCFFDMPPYKPLKHAPHEPNRFLIPPGSHLGSEFRYEFVVTKEMLEALHNGKGRLYFFARIEYRGEDGAVYHLPFCRIYEADIPGNLMHCPSDVKIEEAQSTQDKK